MPSEILERSKQCQLIPADRHDDVWAALSREAEVFGSGAIAGISRAGEARWRASQPHFGSSHQSAELDLYVDCADSKSASQSRFAHDSGSVRDSNHAENSYHTNNSNPNLALETAAMASAGLFAGALARYNPGAVFAATALGVGAYTAFNARNLPVEQFGHAWQTAWNKSDTNSLARAREEVAQGWSGPLFDLALLAGVGGTAATVGSFGVSRLAYQFMGDLPAVRRLDFTEDLTGSRFASGPFCYRPYRAESELTQLFRNIETPRGHLGLRSEANMGLERVAAPTEEPIGLRNYAGPFEHPSVMPDFPPHQRALQYMYDSSSLKPIDDIKADPFPLG